MVNELLRLLLLRLRRLLLSKEKSPSSHKSQGAFLHRLSFKGSRVKCIAYHADLQLQEEGVDEAEFAGSAPERAAVLAAAGGGDRARRSVLDLGSRRRAPELWSRGKKRVWIQTFDHFDK